MFQSSDLIQRFLTDKQIIKQIPKYRDKNVIMHIYTQAFDFLFLVWMLSEKLFLHILFEFFICLEKFLPKYRAFLACGEKLSFRHFNLYTLVYHFTWSIAMFQYWHSHVIPTFLMLFVKNAKGKYQPFRTTKLRCMWQKTPNRTRVSVTSRNISTPPFSISDCIILLRKFFFGLY